MANVNKEFRLLITITSPTKSDISEIKNGMKSAWQTLRAANPSWTITAKNFRKDEYAVLDAAVDDTTD
jgi:hypothetical protein